MKNRKQHVDPIPEDFGSYEAAADFWDTHDTADYLDEFETVALHTEFRRRRYEIDVDDDVVIVLKKLAQLRGIPVSDLASELLRKQLVLAA
jgi:hypothetical protein